MISPPLATAGGHECHLQRRGLGVALAEAGDGQQRDVVDEVLDGPEHRLGRPGQVERRALLKPYASAVATIVGAPTLTAISANAVLQLRPEDLDEVAAAGRAAVVLDRVGGLGR